jgi:hypothetical protein
MECFRPVCAGNIMAHSGSCGRLGSGMSGIIPKKRAVVWARTQRVLLMNNRAQAMTTAADITSKSRIMFVAFVRQLTGKRSSEVSDPHYKITLCYEYAEKCCRVGGRTKLNASRPKDCVWDFDPLQ